MCEVDDSLPIHIELDLREPSVRPRTVAAQEPSRFDGEETETVLAEARRFALDPDRVMRIYTEDPETWHGAYVSGDELLRMLPCRPGHPWLSYVLGGHALGTLPRALFTRRLAPPAQVGERVLLTMGMPASGKTTLVKAGFGRPFFATLDSPLCSFDLARELIREIQATGRGVAIVLAWRPLEQAAAGMLDRAMPGHEERAVPLADMADILLNGLNVFQRLAEINRYDGDATLDLVCCEDRRRTWCAGDEAAAFVAAMREDLLSSRKSVLARLAEGWTNAVRSREAAGESIPEIVRAIAEDGVNFAVLGGQLGEGFFSSFIPDPKPLSTGVRSLMNLPEWRERIPGDLAAADAYETRLRQGVL